MTDEAARAVVIQGLEAALVAHREGRDLDIGSGWDEAVGASRSVRDERLSIALLFWECWADSAVHHWHVYRELGPDDWPRLANHLIAALRHDQPIDDADVLRHFGPQPPSLPVATQARDFVASLTPLQAALWALPTFDLALHLLTFAPFARVSLRGATTGLVIALLVLGMMAAFSSAVLASLAVGRAEFDRRLGAAPRWVRVLGLGSFVYGIVVFMLYSAGYHGSPEITPEGLVLKDHGRIVRTISEAEYWVTARAEVRFLSGFILSFTLFPAIFFTFVKERETPS